MNQKLTLSVVDQSPLRAGGTAGDALWETIHLAEEAEKLGYTRSKLAFDSHAARPRASARSSGARGNLRLNSGNPLQPSLMLAHNPNLVAVQYLRAPPSGPGWVYRVPSVHLDCILYLTGLDALQGLAIPKVVAGPTETSLSIPGPSISKANK